MGNIQCNCYDNRNQTELYSSIESYLIPTSRDLHAPSRNFFIHLDREFAKKYALKDLLSAYPNRRLSSEIIQMIWIHYFTYDESSTVEQTRLEHDMNATPRTHHKIRSSIHHFPKDPMPSPHTPSDHPTLPPLLTTSHSTSSNINDMDRMNYLISDVLRYDVSVLKDHFEGLKRQYKRDGIQLNLQDPAIVKIKTDLLKLHHMPVDYIAKLIVKEMHEPEVESHFAPPNGTSQPTSPPSLDTTEQTSHLHQMSPTSPTNVQLSFTQQPIISHDQPSPTSLFSLNQHSSTSTTTSSFPPLTLSLFQSRFDRCMRIYLDKYYRRGFWLLFCLNLMDHYYHRMSIHPHIEPIPYGSNRMSYHDIPTQPLFLPSSHPKADAPPSLRRQPSHRLSRRRVTQDYTISQPTISQHEPASPQDMTTSSQTSRSRSVRPLLSQTSSVSTSSITTSSTSSSSSTTRSPRLTSSTSTHPSRQPSMSRISVPSMTSSIHATPSITPITTPDVTPTASFRPDIPRLPLTDMSLPKPRIMDGMMKYKSSSVPDVMISMVEKSKSMSISDVNQTKTMSISDVNKSKSMSIPDDMDELTTVMNIDKNKSIPHVINEKSTLHASLQIIHPVIRTEEYVHSPA